MDSYSFIVWDDDNISNETDFNFTSRVYRCGIPPTVPPQVPPYILTVQGVIILLIAIVSTPLNGFLFALITARRRFHQSSFCLPLQIVIIQLLRSIVVLPPIAVTAFHGRFLLGFSGCQFIGMSNGIIITARFMVTLAMALDRFLTVFSPFFYTRHVKKVLIIMTMMVWFWVTVVVGILPLEGILDCYAFQPIFSRCGSANCSNLCQAHSVLIVCVNIICGVFISFVLYVSLYIKGRVLANKVSPNVTLEPELRRKTRKSRRVQITMILLFISIVGCSAPTSAIFLVSLLVERSNIALLIITAIVGSAFFHATAITDAVVILNNSDVKAEIKKISKSLKKRIQGADGKNSHNRLPAQSSNKTNTLSTIENTTHQK